MMKANVVKYCSQCGKKNFATISEGEYYVKNALYVDCVSCRLKTFIAPPITISSNDDFQYWVHDGNTNPAYITNDGIAGITVHFVNPLNIDDQIRVLQGIKEYLSQNIIQGLND